MTVGESMNHRIPLSLSFAAGLAACATVTVFLDRSGQEPTNAVPVVSGQPLGAMPRSREHAVVLSWIFEHRVDAASLEFLAWSAPSPVPHNPFTDEPATLVKLVVKNKSTTQENLEYLSFYLRNLEVLGSVNQTHADAKAAVSV